MTDQEILEENEDKRQQCEVYTRIMGYFRPVSQYNKGKKSEFKERVWFTEEQILKHEKEEKAA
jgi:hypothetical protein